MNKVIILFFISLTSLNIWAQQPKDTLNTEEINVVKPYQPKISDAFKIKANPSISNESVEKQGVDYTIKSMPVASTFTPSKGKAKSVKRAKKERLYDNYISAGFGNYTTPLVEAYMRTFPNRDSEFGALIKHHSSQGGIKDVKLDDSFYKTSVAVYYKNSTRDKDWNISMGADHSLFHWYGLPETTTFAETLLDTINSKQAYFNFKLDGEVLLYNSSFKGLKASVNRLSDAYESTEIRARIQPQFELPISSELFTIDLDLDLLNGNFEKNYLNNTSLNYSYINLGVNPSFEVLRDYFSMTLGAKLYYTVTNENIGKTFNAYPNIDVSYQIVDEVFTVFGGVTGGMNFNTYNDKTAKNPYLSPNFYSKPTDEKYRAYAGFKGKLASNMSYLLKASYADQRDKAFYLLNNIQTLGTLPVLQPYLLGNSFSVVYDDTKTLAFHGELGIDFSKEFTFGGSVDYATYRTETILEAWNLPNLKATVFGDYHTGKWTGNAKLFFIGERNDLELPSYILRILVVEKDHIVSAKAYADLNLGVSYSFSDRLSAFAKANNLLGSNYDSYYNYPTQGIQVLAGITFKFDL
ncbi:MAG TPA: TonB-dependent receptor [Lutibacter sp.]|nr:TonB-dependent receptor [Lutibacter sp.]